MYITMCLYITITIMLWVLSMASNFSFGLVAFSEVNGILVLLAQTIVAFPLYHIILGLYGHILSLKQVTITIMLWVLSIYPFIKPYTIDIIC